MSSGDIQKHIDEYGWHCLYVFDPDGEKNEFSYSIGFEESFGHPEIIIFGLKREVAHSILSDIASDLRNGATFEPNVKLNNVIGGDLDIMFKPVKQAAFDDYLGTAVRFYQRPFRAWVMLWPDKTNILPDEEGCELTVQDEALGIV